MQDAHLHRHPRIATQEVFGTRLDPGDIVMSGDIIDGHDGWNSCHVLMHGKPVQSGAEVTIVRPRETQVHHHHKNSYQETYGWRLRAGDVRQPDDVHASASGKWKKCPPALHGTTVQADDRAVIIRPLPVLVLGA